jgi:hypothetical protein
LIAKLSVRLGISPTQLLELDEVMLKNLITVLKDDAKEIANANRRVKR